MCVCSPCVHLVPKRLKDGVGFSVVGATDDCELLCGCWEFNPSPPRKQQVLVTTEPSQWSLECTFIENTDCFDNKLLGPIIVDVQYKFVK